jgi:hypothetical protein
MLRELDIFRLLRIFSSIHFNKNIGGLFAQAHVMCAQARRKPKRGEKPEGMEVEKTDEN